MKMVSKFSLEKMSICVLLTLPDLAILWWVAYFLMRLWEVRLLWVYLRKSEEALRLVVSYVQSMSLTEVVERSRVVLSMNKNVCAVAACWKMRMTARPRAKRFVACAQRVIPSDSVQWRCFNSNSDLSGPVRKSFRKRPREFDACASRFQRFRKAQVQMMLST